MKSHLNRSTSVKLSQKFFISYSHADFDAVHALWSRLRKYNIDAWLDKKNLRPGQDWQKEIRKAILKSDIVIVCLSQRFNKQQGFRHEELKIALEKAKWLDNEVFIIPIRLEKCNMPDSLRHLNRVDLFEAGGYKRLIHALREHVKSK